MEYPIDRAARRPARLALAIVAIEGERKAWSQGQ
jgi:hypothetical protein